MLEVVAVMVDPQIVHFYSLVDFVVMLELIDLIHFLTECHVR